MSEPGNGEAGSVIVAHPGRQHSHQLALALHQAGMLREYWTGVPAHPVLGGALRRLPAPAFRHDPVDLPRELVRHCFR
ncbi:MAG TPA: hypothetical protein VF771_00195, partial [Longimicrobiaceae bacterium]